MFALPSHLCASLWQINRHTKARNNGVPPSYARRLCKHTDPCQYGFGAEDRGIFLGSNRSHHDRAGPQEQACDDHRAAKQRGNRKSDLSPQGLRELRFAATTRYLGHELRELTGPIRTVKGAALGLNGAKVDGVALG